jgi:protein-disulfide isomerase
MTDLPTPDRSARFLRIAGWSLASLILIGLIGAWFALKPGLRLGHQDTDLASNMPQDEFEQRVRTYLLEHPEIVAEAINRLEARQGEQTATEARAVLKSRSDEVFRDPDSPVGGNPSGDVTLVEFFDYSGPYCRMMPPVLAEAEAADPQLRIVYKELPILGPNSVFAAKAALAADRQGKYVAFHRALFQIRGPLEESKVLEAAAAVGLDTDRMKADMKDAAVDGALEKTGKLAQALQITGTPGFVVGDQLTTGAADLTTLQGLIAKARSGQQDAK